MATATSGTRPPYIGDMYRSQRYSAHPNADPLSLSHRGPGSSRPSFQGSREASLTLPFPVRRWVLYRHQR